MILFLLSSGLFLGWSLGANDGANVFGTAVGSRMLRFKTAATICAVFVVLGALIGGGGTSDSINRLGSISAMTGSFIVALSAAASVFWMSRLKLPVSTSQAIVGAIIGWNVFAQMKVDFSQLGSFALAWVCSPIMAAITAIIIYQITHHISLRTKVHLLRKDVYTRLGFILVCAVGAYSLGANNIANVMGIFLYANPFNDLTIMGQTIFSANQMLFLIGGFAIALGVYTYSNKVIETVGRSIFKLSPGSALTVVFANSIVLYLFSSVELQRFLVSHGLPSLPLVPLSSSQAIVGGVIGIGILKGAGSIRYRILGEIALGWVVTPVIAGILSLLLLYIGANVFNFDLLPH